jgi:hypothetical protein
MGGGVGTLIVTDLSAMVRPGSSSYYRRARHDVGLFNSIMELGDYEDADGSLCWYLATTLPAAEAQRLLSYPLYCYFDGYCAGKIWIDVRVYYVDADGDALITDNAGFDDAPNESGRVYVYGREYWDAHRHHAEPADADWSAILGLAACGSTLDEVTLAQIEESTTSILCDHTCDLVIVQPSDTEPGFSARGFSVPGAL